MKADNQPIYPNIAEKVMTKARIPFLPKETREQYARPHQFNIFVPKTKIDDEVESDGEIRLQSHYATMKGKYKHKRVEKVTRRDFNRRGEVTYAVLWKDGTTSENVPAEALDDHIDNELVRHFIYQIDIRRAHRDNVY